MPSNKIWSAQIRNTTTTNDLQTNKIVILGRVKTIVIRNNNSSPENLWVGFNEDANSKVIVEPGEFIALSKDDGSDYDGNTLSFVYETSNVDNRGYVILETEVENSRGNNRC